MPYNYLNACKAMGKCRKLYTKTLTVVISEIYNDTFSLQISLLSEGFYNEHIYITMKQYTCFYFEGGDFPNPILNTTKHNM